MTNQFEYRCCGEIKGKINCASTCLTLNEDFIALVNPTVIAMYGPMMKTKYGTSYAAKQRDTNFFARAVAYRVVTRWLFGVMGWGNKRPLPACVYHHIRNKYPSSVYTGYEK